MQKCTADLQFLCTPILLFEASGEHSYRFGYLNLIKVLVVHEHKPCTIFDKSGGSKLGETSINLC